MNPEDFDLESRDGVRAMLTAVEEENLKKIFGPERWPLETDEDLLELAKLVEDESDEDAVQRI